ncbi:MAG: nucleotidyltransferase domain-containing protein [Gammaproteobacteria bacterium]|nr:nucleotidyltransferase domain-containing protein [Gammaproteobacteria bacterium]MCY4227746.1 nucleotidyltransferase domain-containing protein [Gammaproteobacteria bacterium]MCY4313286.1 nucleotidyltransferase domain-containing protein [Gammaproteobacteria bacterium]
MSSELINILFKQYRQRVLALLLLNPERTYHVREIARLTGTVPGTLHKELSKLAKAGLLSKQHQGSQVIYQANSNCLIYEELASILRKTSGIADVLANCLSPLSDKIDVAMVFGSVASGKLAQGSDIDLLLIGDIQFREAVGVLYSAQEILGREINPKLYNAQEWIAAKQEGSAFVREVLTKPLINVIGDKGDIG